MTLSAETHCRVYDRIKSLMSSTRLKRSSKFNSVTSLGHFQWKKLKVVPNKNSWSRMISFAGIKKEAINLISCSLF